MYDQDIIRTIGRSRTVRIGVAIALIWILAESAPAPLQAQIRSCVRCPGGCNSKGRHRCTPDPTGCDSKGKDRVSESEGLDTPPVPGELPGGDLADAASDYDMAESLVSEGLGATPGSYGIPNMIGDFFGSGVGSFMESSHGHYYSYGTVPNPGAGGVVGRTKIAENTSPIPQDRCLFNYSYFDNVPLYPGGVNVQRITPGIEKTCLGGMMSVEMKVPMAVTLDTTVTQDGDTAWIR